MNNNEKDGLGKFIKELFKGVAKILPFFERISRGPLSQLLGFLKCLIVFFGLLTFFIYILFGHKNFIDSFLTIVIVLGAFTIFTVVLSVRLKAMEGYQL